MDKKGLRCSPRPSASSADKKVDKKGLRCSPCPSASSADKKVLRCSSCPFAALRGFKKKVLRCSPCPSASSAEGVLRAPSRPFVDKKGLRCSSQPFVDRPHSDLAILSSAKCQRAPKTRNQKPKNCSILLQTTPTQKSGTAPPDLDHLTKPHQKIIIFLKQNCWKCIQNNRARVERLPGRHPLGYLEIQLHLQGAMPWEAVH